MSVRAKCLLSLLAGLLLPAATAVAQDRPAPPPPVPSDKQLAGAIRRGLDYLYGVQKGDGTMDTRFAQQHPGGAEALLVLAALSAGEKSDHPKVAAALAAMTKAQPATVYARSARVMALAQLGGGKDNLDKLNADVAWLIKAMLPSNGWGYGSGHPTTTQQPNWVDNCNSFFAAAALAEAQDAGATVPETVWRKVRAYWTKSQNADGGWGYEPSSSTGEGIRRTSYGTMTAAGVAALMEAERHLPFSEAQPPRLADRDQVNKASKWLAEKFTAAKIAEWSWSTDADYYYIYLYAISRAASLTGARNLAQHDWLAQVAGYLAAGQKADGSWGSPDAPRADKPTDGPVRTCFAVMTLARASRPVLISKLQIGQPLPAAWNDASNMTQWVDRELAWRTGWQNVPPDSLAGCGESPILYVTGQGEIEINKDLAWRLRRHALAGGVILVNPLPGDDAFAAKATQYFRNLLGDYKAGDLPADHPVYNLKYSIAGQKLPKITGIGDGGRTIVFVLQSDLSAAWGAGKAADAAAAFGLIGNLALYATDEQAPSQKLDLRRSWWRGPAPKTWLEFARVRHDGSWAGGSLAAERLTEVLNGSCSMGVREQNPTDLQGEVSDKVYLLWITGSDAPNLKPAQLERLKAFVDRGGTLMVDSTMGRAEFHDAMLKQLQGVFGQLKEVRADHPLITGKFSDLACDVTKVAFTRTPGADRAPASGEPSLLGHEVNGRLAVIVSPIGLMGPASGVRAFGCRGLSAVDARKLAINVLLYSAKDR